MYYVVVQECDDSKVTIYEYTELDEVVFLYKSVVSTFGKPTIFFVTYGKKLELTFN